MDFEVTTVLRQTVTFDLWVVLYLKKVSRWWIKEEAEKEHKEDKEDVDVDEPMYAM